MPALDDISQAAEPSPATAASPAHRVQVHATIKACQAQNGLRHGDHERYRQYCARRLRRVRTRQDVRFPLGRGKTFVPRTLEATEVTTAQHLLIPLFMAERAWAHAMALKQRSAGAPRRVSHHLERRLAKAARWATQLEQLCAATADERTVVEARAYAAWMRGNHGLERERWAEALEAFTAAHDICAQLGSVGSAEDQDLFTLRAEEIEPSVRYCAYNLDLANPGASSGQGNFGNGAVAAAAAAGGDGLGPNDELLAAKLESVLAEERKKQAKALDHVEWRGAEIPVRSEAIAVALLRAREAAAALAAGGDGRESLYLRCIGAYDDAASATAAEAAALQGKGGGARIDEQRRELAALGQYLRHGKLTFMRRRNERLVETMKAAGTSSAAANNAGGTAGGDVSGQRPDKGAANTREAPTPAPAATAAASAADIVHVYDALLQNVRDMQAALAGRSEADPLANGSSGNGNGTGATASMLDDDEDAGDEDGLAARARVDEARFRAWRCYYLAEAYAADEKWRPAALLFDHAQSLCGDAAELVEALAGSSGGGDAGRDDMDKLNATIEGAKCRARAHAFLLAAREDEALVAGLNGIDLSGGGSGSGSGNGGGGSNSQNADAAAAAAGGKKGKGKRKGRRANAVNTEGGLGGGSSSQQGRTLLQRLDDFDGGVSGDPRAANIPPAVVAVPCKPLLLDEAFHRLQFPNLDARAGIAPTGVASGGIRGWVGWALGRT